MTGTSRQQKSVRLALRVSTEIQDALLRAMALTGLSLGDLAYRGALRALEDHERMVLRGADREAFIQALRQPPKPSKKLGEALTAREKWLAK